MHLIAPMTSIGLTLFALSAAFLAYSLAGYPILVAAVGRLFPKPVRKEHQDRPVSVILPVRDGEAWLAAKLDSILSLRYPHDRMEIIVVSDGSEDRTDEIASRYGDRGVRLVRIPASGKAEALNRAIDLAEGEILFFTDVRQPLDPDCLARLVACFADPKVGVVTGELVILDGNTHEEINIGLYWRYEKWIRRQLNRAGSLLVVTGCIYAMRRELSRPLPRGTLIDDAALPVAALLSGYRIVFEERARAFDYPTALNVEFRRKVRTLAGLFQLAGMYPRLLNPFRRVGFHFWSYKFSRLLLPYALIVLAIASTSLPAPWPAYLLCAQAVLYGLAFADPVFPETWALKRVSSMARTFVTLMLAALTAAAVLFVPAERLWSQTRTRAPRTLPR